MTAELQIRQDEAHCRLARLSSRSAQAGACAERGGGKRRKFSAKRHYRFIFLHLDNSRFSYNFAGEIYMLATCREIWLLNN
jgi:hypothetical protein